MPYLVMSCTWEKLWFTTFWTAFWTAFSVLQRLSTLAGKSFKIQLEILEIPRESYSRIPTIGFLLKKISGEYFKSCRNIFPFEVSNGGHFELFGRNWKHSSRSCKFLKRSNFSEARIPEQISCTSSSDDLLTSWTASVSRRTFEFQLHKQVNK